MRGAVRRLSGLGVQLEQACAEGIIDQSVLTRIMDGLQMMAEFAIYQEQQRQLDDWCWANERLFNLHTGTTRLKTLSRSREEEIMYEEYIRSLPEGW